MNEEEKKPFSENEKEEKSTNAINQEPVTEQENSFELEEAEENKSPVGPLVGIILIIIIIVLGAVFFWNQDEMATPQTPVEENELTEEIEEETPVEEEAEEESSPEETEENSNENTEEDEESEENVTE